jgi:dihydroorotate dehydrogenase subfamily 1
MKTKFLGKEISGQFTIPSGIITTNVNVIKRVMDEIPEVGVITTKSIGPQPRAGNREPIITQYAPGSFSNAVGLTNPGSKEFARQLSKIEIPSDKFLLISIFGGNEKEFVEVAKDLEPFADAFELNLSCPHAKGFGMSIGQDPEMVKSIVAAVKANVKVPIIAKLTPNAPSIAEIAKAAVEGGASGICAINTVGPGYYTVDGNPVLTNKKGGLSGKGILPIGLKCVMEVCEAVSVPVIACGGISSAQDVREYEKVGAKIFGIGSALVGLSMGKMKTYFAELGKDIDNDTNNAVGFLEKEIDMSFTKYFLKENKKLTDKLSLLIFDKSINISPGQFVFVWIPGEGEKPFSVLDTNPLTLAIQNVGCLTEKLTNLKENDIVYVRGPYGQKINDSGKKIILVAGGTGGAAVYQMAKEFNNVEMFFGAKNKDHLYYLDEIEKHCKLHVSTDDGSYGYKGFVTGLLEEKLKEMNKDENIIFYNCGPEVMVLAVNEIQKKYFPQSKIFNSIEYVTKCGVGICGNCADKFGNRICVDGPFVGELKCE